MSLIFLLVACVAPPSDTRRGAAPQVDDPPLERVGDAAAEDSGDPPPEGDPIDGAALMFAEGVVHEIDITLDEAAWHTMDADWNTVVAADVTVDGEAIVRAGIHRKGSSTLRDLGGKAAFAVDLGHWEDGRTFHGLRRFALNNMVLDGSMLREHVAAWLYSQLGVPAPRHGYALLRVNGELFGLYGVVESIDQRFVDENWGWDREGWLYDSTWNMADLTSLEAGYFEVQEEGAYGEPFEDLHALVATVDATAPDAALDLLEAHFDVDELLRGQAAEIVMANYDGYAFNQNNYLLYHGPRSDRWHVIPWGQDQTFTGNGSVLGFYNGVLDARCRVDGACAERLDAEMAAVGRAFVDLNVAGYAESTWALIKDACEADPRREMSCDPGGVFDFLARRPESVREELGE